MRNKHAFLCKQSFTDRKRRFTTRLVGNNLVAMSEFLDAARDRA
jgi:hypothetical protein